MRIIKRLHLFVLKSFLPLFAMTFFIVLFIVLMQFLWRYIDDLVGKGLSMSVIAELFFYAAVSMVPMALPLAILLASLMTFGNLGERFELTAMKASGISLLRVMAPLIILISGVAVGAFFFQNDVLPKAQVKMWTLLFSMRQKSPELEIPEGVFYDQIPGINLYVSHKNRQNGMLYDVKIYDVRHGGENVTILVSDSAQMSLTKDMKYIYLHLFGGNQYEKMQPNKTMSDNPFRRENYHSKEILIPFDANFNMVDEGGIADQYVGKNMAQLQHSIDSINVRLDSVGRMNEPIVYKQSFPTLSGNDREIKKTVEQRIYSAKPVNLDSLLTTVDGNRLNTLFSQASRLAEQKKNAIMFESEVMAQEKKILRRHGIELLKKFTLSVACLIFFFIGAPLGAIIRKGGIGMPLVISVLLFLVYYIFDNTGYKMARDGHVEVWFGMWLSTFVLAPLGIFVTYKAMNDSAVFDPDRIKLFFRKIFVRREKRHVEIKEVIINEVNPETAWNMLTDLNRACKEFIKKSNGRKIWLKPFISSQMHRQLKDISEKLEETVDYLRDSHEAEIIKLIETYPVISGYLIYSCRRAIKDLNKTVSIDDKILALLPQPALPEESVNKEELNKEELNKEELNKEESVNQTESDTDETNTEEHTNDNTPE